MSVINTNINALYAQDSSSKVGRALSNSMQRLSTGSRINSAKDDAAGLGITTRMTAQTRGLQMAVRNANDGISLMQTSEGALDEVTSILQRMRELSVQSANGTNNSTDRSSINDEVSQLKTEIDRIASTTQFNNQNLLDGSFKDRQLQIGDKAGQTMKVDIDSVHTKDLGMAGSSFDSNTLVGARFGTVTAMAAGDVMINDQAVATIAAGADIGQVVTAINQSVDNVQASAFNVVEARAVGTGITTNGQLVIKVDNLGGSGASTSYSINASSNMQQLVDNINSQTGGQIQASIADGGKLELTNTTGATITVIDNSNTTVGALDTASGFSAVASGGTGLAFAGFLKLDSKDGNPIRIDTGNLGQQTTGTVSELNNLGFQQVSSSFAKGVSSYTVTGKAFSVAPTAAWGQNDLTINGQTMYNTAIATTSFQGKLDTINNFSDKTGVVATAKFDQTIKIDTSHTVTAGAQLNFNGVAVYTVAATGFLDASAVATAINGKTSSTGITATVDGGNIRLTGENVQQLNISAYETSAGTAYASGSDTTFTTYGAAGGVTTYGAIELKSVNNTPISIAIGDAATQTSTGFLEENVGAADYQVNSPTLGVASGGSLSGLNVLTSATATAAIKTIDNALDAVSKIRSKLGAMENRLTHTVDNLSNIITNTQQSRSRILDTDYASETTALARSQIISQAATAMLAQANQQPQSVLSLLK